MSKKDNLISLPEPEGNAFDALTEVLRSGAQQLIRQAVEIELQAFLDEYRSLTVEDRRAVVRNGYLPTRSILTGIGGIDVQVPKVRDRSGQGIKFTSNIVPPYLRRTKCIEEFLPWLYLRGISTGDFGEALSALIGPGAHGLSANTISRLKQSWLEEYEEWRHRDLSRKRYVYVWADGVYSKIRMDHDKLCLLVIIGATAEGQKELLGLYDGYRESKADWLELIRSLKAQGLQYEPKLAIGDGALGFWAAISEEWPTTEGQRCWVHKTQNVLNKLPNSMQSKVKADLHEIWMAETKEQAYKAFDQAVHRYENKYPKAMECLEKDKDALLAFYDYPAKHWIHIRTTNPIESTFATVRLRTARTKNCGSRSTTMMMVFKLIQSAEKRWRRLKGSNYLAEVIEGVIFRNGERVSVQADEVCAA